DNDLVKVGIRRVRGDGELCGEGLAELDLTDIVRRGREGQHRLDIADHADLDEFTRHLGVGHDAERLRLVAAGRWGEVNLDHALLTRLVDARAVPARTGAAARGHDVLDGERRVAGV